MAHFVWVYGTIQAEPTTVYCNRMIRDLSSIDVLYIIIMGYCCAATYLVLLSLRNPCVEDPEWVIRWEYEWASLLV
jgi:hypothetical protein